MIYDYLFHFIYINIFSSQKNYIKDNIQKNIKKNKR